MIFHRHTLALSSPWLFLVLLLSRRPSIAAESTVCNSNEIRTCLCPGNDGTDHTGGWQSCFPNATGWTECAPCLWYDEWCDDETNLCWQDPPKDANVESRHGGVTAWDAMRYCEELAFGGHNDWRLPTLEELRSIVRGAGIMETMCPISEGSTMSEMSLLDVILCAGTTKSFECPGSGGCCWNQNLHGSCNTIDPASTTHYLEFWSSTPAADDPENWLVFGSLICYLCALFLLNTSILAL
jgi:Protein of unknown function (DUF1566)